ncbi:uncharacterized protein PITG_08678 [Phytophthora infestans T30-4]|uniref:Uncharacterized protein n=1 Tax=Phytophthora infestans (strain T30-4) TaxID=403677 RepID=D0NCX5_PHYIT|nr:uncharacterized protein PITG_08678 [Phytophthora infestans T30-4]EEY55932.1 conserved hypothetical protein [Phytophthora infestans T30-4]|eukprot:XP_002902762.1 conserved hypothetical protein [Phytophthora infestans T30-4]
MQRNGVLPAINAGTPSVAHRGVSPNVAKRAAWFTPRDGLGTPDRRTEQQSLASVAVPADGAFQPRHEQSPTITQPTSTSLEDALEVLHEVLIETDNQSDSAQRRDAALEETTRLHATEGQELERARFAADEQMQTTLELLQAELARERRAQSTREGSRPVIVPSTEKKSHSKRQAARLAPRLRNSPFKPRSKEFLSIKLHELWEERAYSQQDYETMREQVIEEKIRQVTLFQRLETARCSHTRQLNDAEAALRASQADGERLQARLAQARVSAAHEARRTAALAQSSKAERQRLVCALAETRHKFREWKEGEAATLRATREQAVHALRTEYELKLARHQEEKQKLRDKVKDLEVSLRLLQRDRQLSPDQLSERKGTLLQFTPGGVGFGDVGAADFIEAQGRIQELEGLLQLSKERQERQDELLRVSETALTRLNQERELDALENLSLPSPAVALALTNLTGVTPVEETDKPSGRRQSSTGGTDIEKEVLRRNSIVLSAEVNRYQKIVVQSMEEVRALKEFRRQTRSGSADNSAIVLTAREAYLLEELAASQREIDTMKAKLRKMRKKRKSKAKSNEKELLETDAAVMMIQSFSKGFLARRQFIRKKLAIGKIKARYRGYLVRKNYEALGSSMITTDRQLLPSGLTPEAAHDYLLVTEAMQYKMQIVEPHHEEPYICEGGGQSTSDMVDVVLRVSKDPPILQLQTTPSTPSNQETAVARVAYFHLFETIALLPYEDEEVVLETSSEKEIARIFAARLVVQCKGSDNRDYHFFITRTSKKEQESAANGKEDLVLGRRPRTLLTELPVQPMETRATSASSDTFEPPLDGAESVFVHEVDLDLLIREARTDPLKEDSASTRCVTGEDEVSEHGTARV